MKLVLTADKELLTPEYKHFLNPLQFTIIGAKDLPSETNAGGEYQPVYVRAKFFDGTEIKTPDIPHSETCKWYYKQVLLTGFMNPVLLKEQLATTPMKVSSLLHSN